MLFYQYNVNHFHFVCSKVSINNDNNVHFHSILHGSVCVQCVHLKFIHTCKHIQCIGMHFLRIKHLKTLLQEHAFSNSVQIEKEKLTNLSWNPEASPVSLSRPHGQDWCENITGGCGWFTEEKWRRLSCILSNTVTECAAPNASYMYLLPPCVSTDHGSSWSYHGTKAIHKENTVSCARKLHSSLKVLVLRNVAHKCWIFSTHVIQIVRWIVGYDVSVACIM